MKQPIEPAVTDPSPAPTPEVPVNKKWRGLSEACVDALHGATLIVHGEFKDSVLYVPAESGKAVRQALQAQFNPQGEAKEFAEKSSWVYDAAQDGMVEFRGFILPPIEAKQIIKSIEQGNTPGKSAKYGIARGAIMHAEHGAEDACLSERLEQLSQAQEALAEPETDDAPGKPESPKEKQWISHHGTRGKFSHRANGGRG